MEPERIDQISANLDPLSKHEHYHLTNAYPSAYDEDPISNIAAHRWSKRAALYLQVVQSDVSLNFIVYTIVSHSTHIPLLMLRTPSL